MYICGFLCEICFNFSCITLEMRVTMSVVSTLLFQIAAGTRIAWTTAITFLYSPPFVYNLSQLAAVSEGMG